MFEEMQVYLFVHKNREGIDMKIKVFGYCRVSGLSQVEKYGFDRQEEAIKEYCQRRKLELVEIFKEQVSGTTDESERPLFIRMIKRCLSEGISIVVIEDLDRLARDSMIAQYLLSFLTREKISLISCATGKDIVEEFNSDPAKKLIVQIMSDIAEFERRQIIARLKKGREKKTAETGWRGGPPPYGYGVHGPLESEQRILAEIAHKRRLNRGKRMSYKKIAEHLNSQGLYSRKGKSWTPSLVFNIYEKFMRGRAK
jgi:DNA invertase Pin-like site-specific DNA recombinase